MTVGEFADLVSQQLQHNPTSQQRALIQALARFCASSTPYNSVFILNGYAGTGKTSVVAALVNALTLMRRGVVMLAPTGRAAKVMATISGRKAFTIHRKIYQGDSLAGDFRAPAHNPHSDTIFIVDEASMIGAAEGENLLDDLIHYVYSGDNCRMILVGDTAQLPPVGCTDAPAMEPDNLRRYGLKVAKATMTQTVRQRRQSAILANATLMRKAQEELAKYNDAVDADDVAAAGVENVEKQPESFNSRLILSDTDVKAIPGEELEEWLSDAYRNDGVDNTILITRSNKRAMQFNLAIRRQILDKERDLTEGEPLLICKNNYFITSKIKGADFLANGEIARIEAIYGYENRIFLRFADVALYLPDRDLTIDAKLLLNTLNSETAGLSDEYEQLLYRIAMADLPQEHHADRNRVARHLKTHPYYQALRVKYAYALTCHKAQGGQWPNVFVDLGGIAPAATNTLDYLRWLYTATTRATTRLYYLQ